MTTRALTMPGGPPAPPGGVRNDPQAPEQRPRSRYALAATITVLAGLAPALILLSSGDAVWPATALQLVVTLHAGTALAFVLTASTVRIVELGFWLFGYLWLGLAPLAMLSQDTYPLQLPVLPAYGFSASLLVWVSFIAFSLGTVLAQRYFRGPPAVLEKVLLRELSLTRTLILAVVAIGLAIVLIPRLGGIGTFFASRVEISAVLAEISGEGNAIRALIDWSLSITAFWALVALIVVRPGPRDDPRLGTARWVLLPILVGLNVIINNPITQPRFWFGTVILALIFMTKALRSVRAFRIAGVALLAVVLVIFPFADYFRTATPSFPTTAIPQTFVSNGDYDAYQQVATGMEYVAELGHQPQWALGPALFWVPRAIWPDKPEDTGAVIGEWANYEYVNLSAPLSIEAFIWGGWLVAFAAFLGLGLLERWLDMVNGRFRRAGTVIMVLAPTLAFFQIIVLRGSLLPISGPLLILIAVPFLISRRAGASPSDPDAEDRAGRKKQEVQ